ncbi:unnamed protein product [Adineta steineri]|uniref:Alpha 1,4-glycosyltransferase domain-containing protein n=1 Tax=Adineta steineri TaxID=433720 RepID=A0A815PZR8_9BILA|nr:unnamed protein product [Adineta steineri]CAF1631961.1 unnamed protein product [Adineta steineri]
MIIFTIVYLSVTQLSKASLYGVLNIFTVNFNDISVQHLDKDSTNYILLQNITEKESDLINAKLKIFFVQTSENEDILSRHACSIESAARLHSDGLIFVLMRSKYILRKSTSYKHLESYENLYIVHFNEEDIYSGTSLSRLNQTKRKQYIHYFSISHMSDFIRTALLYKYGGIYFDLDVIPLKKFHEFSNTVALETSVGVNVAVLVFVKQHLVLDLQMDIQLQTISNQFHALCWNCLGPSALTDALKDVCDHHQLYIHQKDKCHEIDIQPSYVFYPIPYQQIPQFFRRSSDNVNYLLKNSSIYSIHYFHHMTMNIPIEIKSPFAQIAEIYCPNVYKQLMNENLSNNSSNFLLTNTNIILFCLCISFLCIFILILIGHFLSYISIFRKIMFAIRHKFYKTHF